MISSLNDPGLAGPPSPYDDPTPCPECGAEDAEYGLHENDCPSGYPTFAASDPLSEAAREYEDEHPMAGPF